MFRPPEGLRSSDLYRVLSVLLKGKLVGKEKGGGEERRKVNSWGGHVVCYCKHCMYVKYK